MSFFLKSTLEGTVRLRRFKTREELKSLLDKRYKGENFSDEKALLIFDTERQHGDLSKKLLLCFRY
jgi:hypothetical protein